MKIEFPCPVSPSELSPTAQGMLCLHCAKEVIDVDGLSAEEVKALAESKGSICVSTSDPTVVNFSYSLRKFALSLLIVFGSSLFTFADAQLADKVGSVKIEKPIEASIALMQISFVDQKGGTLSSSVDVAVELPNGKVIAPVLKDDGTFWLEIPAYCKGKQVLIVADRFGKKKYRSVYISGLGQEIYEEIKFKIKKIHYRYRTIGCPSF